MFRSFLRPFRHLPSSLPSPSPTLRLLSTTPPTTPEPTHIPLKSIYLARTIDVIGVYQTVFGDGYVHKFGKDSVIVELPRERGGGGTIKGRIDELNEKVQSSATLLQKSSTNINPTSHFLPPPSHSPSPSSYLVVFAYGSCVFFNVPPPTQLQLLKVIKSNSTNPISSGFEHVEEYKINVNPEMERATHMGKNKVSLKKLDLKNVNVIAAIMAQSVALDYYYVIVDNMLETFTSLNRSIERTGTFTTLEKQTLFKIVAENNSIFIGLVSKLGLLERSEQAWEDNEYESIWKGMRSEFEMKERFDNLEFKLNLIQNNAKFFIEILHNQKANNAEWIIIGLIALESVLMVVDMSGNGAKVFGWMDVFS
ncbi:hypothetical protein TrLO_g15504 [Triparma laevis f. longispina]|uniref:DUF155 domain-containing protein n=1 Tax=Triparma laevis f. longispina TaxID=1714387 RepID=A0A9W6ZB42_9STRA|nr:hypothetical protein TrLO_g15504 [Triparma laevis f. longispina]